MCRKKSAVGASLIFTAGFLWGFIGLFVKQMAAHGSSPVFTAFLRVFFAFVIMLFITAAKFGIKAFKVDRRTLISSALLGIVCHGIYNVFYSYAVTLSGVAVSAVLLNLAPIFTMAAAIGFLGEKFSPVKAAAVAVNVAGCVMTALCGSNELGTVSAVGVLCGVGAGLCYALTAIFGKLAADNSNSFVVSAYSYMFAAIFLLLYLIISRGFVPLNSGIAAWGFGLALFPTALAYLLYYSGIKLVGESSKAPVIASVETAVAAVLGVAIYHERLTIIGILGILLVFLSIMLMNRT